MIVSLRHLLGWIVSSFSLPQGPRPRELGSPPATARVVRSAASYSIDCPAQTVLGGVENVLVWVEEASRLGYSANRRYAVAA